MEKSYFERIDFLAITRNAALAPLYDFENIVPNLNRFCNHGSYHSDKVAPSQLIHLYTTPDFQVDRKFDQVLFINDIIFTADDATRLLELNADMACGFDIISSKGNTAEFWDRWVLRDRHGDNIKEESRFTWPYFGDAYTVRKASQYLPVPVYGCWNGMAAISAEPFYKGIRFRSSHGECYASECSWIYVDMWNQGFTNHQLDPTVLVAYEYATYNMYSSFKWYQDMLKNRPSIQTLRENNHYQHNVQPYQQRPSKWVCCPGFTSSSGTCKWIRT